MSEIILPGKSNPTPKKEERLGHLEEAFIVLTIRKDDGDELKRVVHLGSPVGMEILESKIVGVPKLVRLQAPFLSMEDILINDEPEASATMDSGSEL